MKHVTRDFPPTMLLHGTVDTDVPYEQSVLMANELKRNGVKHKLVTLKDFGHAFDFFRGDAPEVQMAYKQAINFLQQQLRKK